MNEQEKKQEEAIRLECQQKEEHIIEGRQLTERQLIEERQRQEIQRMQDEQRRQEQRAKEAQQKQENQQKEDRQRTEQPREQSEESTIEYGQKHGVPIAPASNTKEWCSKLVGTYDKKKVSSNYNADIMGVGKGQGTSSSTEEKRIIKPEEFAYLKDVVCVFPNGYKHLKKANYYEDSTFTSKL